MADLIIGCGGWQSVPGGIEYTLRDIMYACACVCLYVCVCLHVYVCFGTPF